MVCSSFSFCLNNPSGMSIVYMYYLKDNEIKILKENLPQWTLVYLQIAWELDVFFLFNDWVTDPAWMGHRCETKYCRTQQILLALRTFPYPNLLAFYLLVEISWLTGRIATFFQNGHLVWVYLGQNEIRVGNYWAEVINCKDSKWIN